MQVSTRIAALVFVVPFTVAVCILAVESETYSAVLVVGQHSAPMHGPERSSDDR
jgi:hypothetical protein